MEVIISLVSAFFFAFTFVLNEFMANDGGYFMYSASLRFLFVLPLIYPILKFKRRKISRIMEAIKLDFWGWFIYSQIGFVLFYLPICFASSFAPGWLVASTWQLTIICGTLLIPFIREDESHRINPYDFIYFFIILTGVYIIEFAHIKKTDSASSAVAFFSVLISCFAYPLGNRKIMSINKRGMNLSALERTFAMTVLSIPTWIIIFLIAYLNAGAPSKNQIISSFVVALFSGVIATVLFFKATAMVSSDMRKLATVEASASFEIIFTVVLGMILLGHKLPSNKEMLGIIIIIIGMILKTSSANLKKNKN